MEPAIPFDVRQAFIRACGKAFWYKDPLRELFLHSGIPESLFDRYADESKFKLARHVLAELDQRGPSGLAIQRRLIQEMCRLRNVPDEAADREAGLQALRDLKQLASKTGVAQDEEVARRRTHAEERARREAAILARAEKVKALQTRFSALSVSTENPQARGYSLEDIVAELFEIEEIPYRPPYKTDTEQIDGSFSWRGFDYLVEARWRKDPPNQADLGAFKTKVDKKISSTRGVFVSVVGYRSEVVAEFTRGVTSNIVLFDGLDLTLILEGHVSLTDALAMKVEKAAQEGDIYFPLSQRFVA